MTRSAERVPPLDVSYSDDPDVVAQAAAEDYSLHAVPKSWRSSRLSLSMAWFALMSAMFWVVVGSTLTLQIGTINTLVGICASVVVYGVINGIASRYANLSGTSVALFSRSVFGQIGATFAAALFGITITYYAVAEGSIVAVALHAYFGGPPLQVWYLIVVAYNAPLVIKGVRTWLDKINGLLLPFYLLGLIGSVVWAVAKYGYSNDWLFFTPPGTSGFSVSGSWFAFTVYMGVWVVVMMTWDYARFGRNEDARFNGRISFGIPFYVITLLVNAAVGILIVSLIPIPGALSEETAILGVVALMGFWGMLWIFVSQTRINTANFYLASSNYQNFFARAFRLVLPRTFWLAVVAVVVYLMMLTNVLSYLLEALQFQGVVIVAWVAIVLTHIAWSKARGDRPDSVEFRPGRVPLVNPGGMTAWVLSSLVGIVLLAAGGSFGGTWAPPIAFVVAAATYGLSLTFAKPSWFTLARPHDPRNEVDDHWESRVRCFHCERAYVAYEMDRDPANGHQPICLACASNHRTFLAAARDEARNGPAPDEAGTDAATGRRAVDPA